MSAFRIGEPFDPREAQSAGRYPVDWVKNNQDLSDGPKGAYDYLYGIAARSDRKEQAWNGYVYPDIETIAVDLGKAPVSVRRDLAALKNQKLLRIERPNKREGNRYFFLWKEEFERSWRKSAEREQRLKAMASKKRLERSNVSCQDHNDERPNPHSSALESEHPERSNVSAPYKEDPQFYSQGIPSSSSCGAGCDHTSDREKTDPEKKTKMVPFSPNPKTPEPQKTWYADAETQQRAAEILQRSADSHRYRICRPLGSLEVSTILCILPNMASLEDLQLWLDSSVGFLTKADSWGRFVTDSRKWPGRREETMALVARSVPVPETERESYASPPAEPEPGPVHSAPEPASQPARCRECLGSGIRQTAAEILKATGDFYEWCTCPAGPRERERTPREVDRSNEAARKNSAKVAKVTEIPTPCPRSPQTDHKGMQQAGDVMPIALVAKASG